MIYWCIGYFMALAVDNDWSGVGWCANDSIGSPDHFWRRTSRVTKKLIIYGKLYIISPMTRSYYVPNTGNDECNQLPLDSHFLFALISRLWHLTSRKCISWRHFDRLSAVIYHTGFTESERNISIYLRVYSLHHNVLPTFFQHISIAQVQSQLVAIDVSIRVVCGMWHEGSPVVIYQRLLVPDLINLSRNLGWSGYRFMLPGIYMLLHWRPWQLWCRIALQTHPQFTFAQPTTVALPYHVHHDKLFVNRNECYWCYILSSLPLFVSHYVGPFNVFNLGMKNVCTLGVFLFNNVIYHLCIQ